MGIPELPEHASLLYEAGTALVMENTSGGYGKYDGQAAFATYL